MTPDDAECTFHRPGAPGSADGAVHLEPNGMRVEARPLALGSRLPKGRTFFALCRS